MYGVPWYVDTRLLFYRRDLLEAAGIGVPPASWPEWMRALAAIKAHADAGRYAILLPLNEFEPLLALALQQDDPLLRDGGRYGNFESAGFRRALGLYVDMFRRGLCARRSPHRSSRTCGANSAAARSRSTFPGRGTSASSSAGCRPTCSTRGRPRRCPVPPVRELRLRAGRASSCSAHRACKDAAWQLIEYLARPDVELRFHALTGDLPPRRSAWNDPGLAGDVHARAFRDQLERVKPAPKVPEWERIADEMHLVAERAARGEWSVDEAVRELDARADRILEKRRWLLAREARS